MQCLLALHNCTISCLSKYTSADSKNRLVWEKILHVIFTPVKMWKFVFIRFLRKQTIRGVMSYEKELYWFSWGCYQNFIPFNKVLRVIYYLPRAQLHLSSTFVYSPTVSYIDLCLYTTTCIASVIDRYCMPWTFFIHHRLYCICHRPLFIRHQLYCMSFTFDYTNSWTACHWPLIIHNQ